MRRTLTSCWGGAAARSVVFVLALAHAAEGADHCAPGSLPTAENSADAEQLGVGVSLGLEHATYATERYAGHFTGFHLGVTYAHTPHHGPAWDVLGTLPAYHLVRNGSERVGVGDPMLRARIRLWQPSGGNVALGAALGVSFPLGDAAADLGMGHVMLHPALWVDSITQSVRLHGVLGYGGAVAAGGHEGGPGPLVHPMNASELSASGTAVYRVLAALELRAAVHGAVPLVSSGGEARAVATGGLGLTLGRVRVGSDFSWALLGDPFREKLEVTVGAAF